MKELLILGVDPGTTTAYALLDLQGNLKKLKSAKGLTLGKLIGEVVDEGKIIVVGTDVKYNPKFVEKICSILGAKLLSPGDNIKAGMKDRITSSYKVKDDHQRDALASALLAYKKVKDIFDKVDLRLKEIAKEHLSDDVKLLALHGYSIVDAVNKIEKKEIVSVKKKRIKEKVKKSMRIFEENEKLKVERKLLEKKISDLLRKLQETEKSIHNVVREKVEKNLEIKNKNINSILLELNTARKEIELLRGEIENLNEALIEMEGKIVARKFDNLSQNIVNSNLKSGEVILVDDPNIFSEKSLSHLKELGIIVVCNREPNKYLKESDITLIDLKNVNHKKFSRFILVNRSDIDKEIKNFDILAKIVKEYKEKRKII